MEYACKEMGQDIASTSAPWRSLPAWSVSTTACGSNPDSRGLFVTGAKVGTASFCSWKRRYQLRPLRRRQPCAATTGRETTPGRPCTRRAGEQQEPAVGSGGVEGRGKAQVKRQTRGNGVWRHRWGPAPTPPRPRSPASPTRTPAGAPTPSTPALPVVLPPPPMPTTSAHAREGRLPPPLSNPAALCPSRLPSRRSRTPRGSSSHSVPKAPTRTPTTPAPPVAIAPPPLPKPSANAKRRGSAAPLECRCLVR